MQHRAKKSLGQNFLKSEPALKKIVDAGEVNSSDIVLEIGPGKGALTKKLLATSCQLIAVEKDHNLYELLKDKFKKEITNKKLFLIEGDILEFEMQKVLQDVVFKSIAQGGDPSIAKIQQNFMCSFKNNILQNFNYKIIANIPYNITGAILKKFLTEENQPTMMVLMVQHEVAKRILVRDGKESILSISVKAYGNPKIEMKVPARYFSPAPKVDSAIISIKNISRVFFTKNNIEESKFWEIIHAGFAHKRKKLSNNLKNLVSKTDGNKRAEELTLPEWVNIIKI